MNKSKIDKVIIGLLLCIILYNFYNNYKKKNEDKYYIERKKYTICGKDIYITDFTYQNYENGNVLNSSELLSEIEYLCKGE